MIGIYKITNPKGEVYIGKSKNVYNRMQSHKSNNGTYQLKLSKSFSEYGFSNHIFTVICKCEESELKDREIFFIDKYDSINNGLNTQLPNRDKFNLQEEPEEICVHCILKEEYGLKSKQIHLDEKVIEILTIKAVKEKTTFKELVQKILTDKSKEYEIV